MSERVGQKPKRFENVLIDLLGPSLYERAGVLAYPAFASTLDLHPNFGTEQQGRPMPGCLRATPGPRRRSSFEINGSTNSAPSASVALEAENVGLGHSSVTCADAKRKFLPNEWYLSTLRTYKPPTLSIRHPVGHLVVNDPEKTLPKRSAGTLLLEYSNEAANEGPNGEYRGVLACARAGQKRISVATIISLTSFALGQLHEGV
jgi:hypothetical protein